MKPELVDAQIRELAAARRLPDSHLARWLKLDAASRAAFLRIAGGLRLRTGQLVTALEMLDEIAVREDASIAAILERRELKRIAEGSGSAPSRASALLEALRGLRFPRLKQMQEQLRTQISALKLPRGITIDLPKDLGSDELMVSLKARSGAELTRLIEALEHSRAGLTQVIEKLGGKQ